MTRNNTPSSNSTCEVSMDPETEEVYRKRREAGRKRSLTYCNNCGGTLSQERELRERKDAGQGERRVQEAGPAAQKVHPVTAKPLGAHEPHQRAEDRPPSRPGPGGPQVAGRPAGHVGAGVLPRPVRSRRRPATTAELVRLRPRWAGAARPRQPATERPRSPAPAEHSAAGLTGFPPRRLSGGVFLFPNRQTAWGP